MIGTSFGPYQVQARLGGGGMGEVYTARDPEHGNRIVALKVLPENLSGDPEFRARFRREAEHAARMSDPHIATIHRYGEIDGRLFLAMELVDGQDLGALVKKGPLPPATAVEIVEQIAAALDSAHAGGLVHRDVKPSNVIVREQPDGRPPRAVLIDFGIATATDPGSRTALTRTGVVVGTLSYMAPERFAGQLAGPSSDIYSLACVLHELLTGRQPFEDSGLAAQVVAHMQHPPPRPSTLRPGLPPELDTVVAVGMAKDPAARYRTAGALAAAARRAVGSTPRVAVPPSPTVVGAEPARTEVPSTEVSRTEIPSTYVPNTYVPSAFAPTFVGVPLQAPQSAPPARPSLVRAWLAPAGAGIGLGALVLVVILLTGLVGAENPGPPPEPTAAAPVVVEPSTDPITDRAFPGAAVQGQPNAGHLGATPVLLKRSPLEVLDLATGTPLGVVPPLDGLGATVVRHAGKSLLLAPTFDNVVRVVDLTTGEALPTTFAGHTEVVAAAAVGEVDGRVVVATSSADSTRLWDLGSGEPIGQPLPVGPSDEFGSTGSSTLQFVSHDGGTTLVGNSNHVIRSWNPRTGAMVAAIPYDEFQFHAGTPVAVIGGQAIAIAERSTFETGIRRWTLYDLASGAPIRDVTVSTTGLASRASTTSPSALAEVGGRGVLLVGSERAVVMFDLATGAQIGAPLIGHEDIVDEMTVVEAGDKPLLLTASNDHSIRVWDLAARSGG